MQDYSKALKAQENCLNIIRFLDGSIHDYFPQYRLIFDAFLPNLKKSFAKLKSRLLDIVEIPAAAIDEPKVALAQMSDQIDEILESLYLHVSLLISDRFPETISESRYRTFVPIIDKLIAQLEICHQKKVEWYLNQQKIIKNVIKAEMSSPVTSPVKQPKTKKA